MRSKSYVKASPEVVADVGANAALILDAVASWVITNANSNRQTHRKDGHWWTYGSVRYWQEQIWYLSEDQIRRGLEKLVREGYLISGNYNKSTYDRTTWYSLGPNGEKIYIIDEKDTPTPKKERSRRCKAGPDDITEDVQRVIDKWNEDPNVVPIPDRISLGTIHDIKGKISGYGLETFLGIIEQYQKDGDGWYVKNENTNTFRWFLGQKDGVENVERFAGLEKKARRQAKAAERSAKAETYDSDWKAGLYKLGILTDEGFDAEAYFSASARFSEKAQAEIKAAYL